jgi:hypothetical protein
MAHNAGVCAVAGATKSPKDIAYTQNYAPFLFVYHPVKIFQMKKKARNRNFLYLAQN